MRNRTNSNPNKDGIWEDNDATTESFAGEEAVKKSQVTRSIVAPSGFYQVVLLVFIRILSHSHTFVFATSIYLAFRHSILIGILLLGTDLAVCFVEAQTNPEQKKRFTESQTGKWVISSIIALFVFLMMPAPASTLVALLARVSFCTGGPENVSAFKRLRKGKKLRLLGFEINVIGPVILFAMLTADRFTYRLLWSFPSPKFNVSMILGQICALTVKSALRIAYSHGLFNGQDNTATHHAFIAITSFQLLCFVCIPLFFGGISSSASKPLLKATNLNDSKNLEIPEPFCSKLLKNELSSDSFFALATAISGWQLDPARKDVFYELVRASETCDLGNPILNKIAYTLRLDWFGISSDTISTAREIPTFLNTLKSNLKEIITAVTASVTLLSTLRLYLNFGSNDKSSSKAKNGVHNYDRSKISSPVFGDGHEDSKERGSRCHNHIAPHMFRTGSKYS
mmetsp:Transcript_2397/g.3428  ORF Transcript_2397/g.3428 Transcript_2397/m.3428 type:complete len:455 (+) Transcript_2397:116-1480(+)